MNPQAKKWLKSFLIELVVYAVLVFGYFFLVLHFLGGWLHRLFEHLGVDAFFPERDRGREARNACPDDADPHSE